MDSVRRLFKSCLTSTCIVSLILIGIVAVSRVIVVITCFVHLRVLDPLSTYVGGHMNRDALYEIIMNTTSSYDMYYHVLGCPIMPHISTVLTFCPVLIFSIVMSAALLVPASLKIAVSFMYSNSEYIIVCSITLLFICITMIVHRAKEKQL